MKHIRKITGIFGTLLSTLLLAAGILFIGLAVFGYKFYAVKTGSMQSSYPVGTLLIVQDTEPEIIEAGDVISFVTAGDLVVTHRVTENDTVNRCITTRGDENNADDSEPVAYENVLGKVVLGIPGIGNAALALQSGVGRVLVTAIVVLTALYLMAGFIRPRVHAYRSRRKD